MKLFQIAFLLFNIVAISAKNPPKNVQVVWSGSAEPTRDDLSEDSDEDIAMSRSTNFAAMQEINRSYTSYEQRSDFMADSENIPVAHMTAELLAAESKKMRKKANELIDAHEPKKSKYIESRKATYTVTFIELQEDEVLQLLNIGGTFPGFPLPKRVMAEVKIQENMDKVLARIQIKGVAKFIGKGCVTPLMAYYDEQNQKVKDEEGEVQVTAVLDWKLPTDVFADIIGPCKEGSFTKVDPMELAKHLDTNGRRKVADGNITVPELLKLTGISTTERQTLMSPPKEHTAVTPGPDAAENVQGEGK